MIDIIIFSKDRACQLDLTIRSIIENMFIDYTISIIYTSSNKFYYDGYQFIKTLYPNINFIEQGIFKNDLVHVVSNIQKYYLALADDTIFIEKIVYDNIFKTFETNKEVMTINTRIGKSVLYNYLRPNEPIIKSPIFNNDNTYDWRLILNPYWNHPMTSCGHICRVEDIKSFIQNSIFENPNSLEGNLIELAKHKRLNICYDRIKVIELCVNLVNTTNRANVHGIDIENSTEELNKKWLDGYRINPDILDYNVLYQYQKIPNIKFKYEKINSY